MMKNPFLLLTLALTSSYYYQWVQCYSTSDSPYVANLELSPVLMGVLLLIIGFIFLFFGVRLLKPILFLSGLAVGGLLAYIVLLNVDHDFGDKKDLVFLLVPLITGLILGSIFITLVKVGVLGIGCLGGFSLATWGAAFLPPDALVNSDIYRPIFIALCVCLGALLMLFFERLLLIISTAAFGAGALCAGMDVFIATGFIQAAQYIWSNKNSFVINDKLLGLLGSYAVLLFFGILIQLKFHTKACQPKHAVK